MRSPGLRNVVLLALMGVALLCRSGQGQVSSAAPKILRSVVLHPCPSATECGAEEPVEGGSVIAPARSSGSMSGRLATPTGPGAASTRYTSDPAVSARVRGAFVRGLERRLNEVQAEAIARNLRDNDPIARWSAMVSDDGLRSGDMADALASYWVLNWAMANGSEASPAATLAVREQVRWAVANQPLLKGLTDAEKQTVAEEAMLNFVYEVTGYLQARKAGNGSVLGRISQGAETRFQREMAVDLRSLLLTSKGLEAKR